jgi:hypothetical protein
MKIYKHHIWIYLINVSPGVLVSLSTQFEWALNVFNFSTVVFFLLTLLIMITPSNIKDKDPKAPLPKNGSRFVVSLRISLILFCAALGLLWQAILWLLILIIIHAEAKREEKEQES